jgi:hypothetical protein
MYLEDCKAQIDAGKTAEHLRWRSVLHFQIRKEGDYYARHAEGYKNPHGVLIVKPDTIYYSSWEEIIDAFNGYYDDSGWELTNEPFRDYLPIERQEP